jgi:hypothetical protein
VPQAPPGATAEGAAVRREVEPLFRVTWQWKGDVPRYADAIDASAALEAVSYLSSDPHGDLLWLELSAPSGEPALSIPPKKPPPQWPPIPDPTSPAIH